MCIMSRTAGISSWGTKQKPSILLAKWWRSALEAIASMPLGQDFFTLFYPLQFVWSCRAALQRIRKNCRSQDSPALLGFRSVWWALSRLSCAGNVSAAWKMRRVRTISRPPCCSCEASVGRCLHIGAGCAHTLSAAPYWTTLHKCSENSHFQNRCLLP